MFKEKIMVKGLALLAGLFILTLSASIAQAQNAPVEKTGQTASYATYDDGYYQMGVAWPSPRFVVSASITSSDLLTGLMWLRDAQKITGIKTFADAITACEYLDLGGCASGINWRLPNRYELESLLDMGNYDPALPNDNVYVNVMSDSYWSSTTDASNTDNAWSVDMYNGRVASDVKTQGNYVWCLGEAD